jgi:hypothetical protein
VEGSPRRGIGAHLDDGGSKTLNPDLVFDGGRATGDVKYKLTGNDWNTEDLAPSAVAS